MSNALVVTPKISGAISNDTAANISIDITLDSGSIRYTLLPNANVTVPLINTDVTVCGVTGSVERVGLTESRSEFGNIVDAVYGSTSKSKSIFISFPLDTIAYKAVTASQIIQKIQDDSKLIIDNKIAEFHFESYEFRGKAIDAIKDIASKCFAEAIIIAPKHWQIVPLLSSSGSYTEPSDTLVSRQNLVINNTATLAGEYFNKLISAYVDHAGLLNKRKSVNDIIYGNKTEVRENVVNLQLSFGKGSGQIMHNAIIVESLNWDTWEYTLEEGVNGNGKWSHPYFKVETLRALKTKTDVDGKKVTVETGKKRGLYALNFTKLLLEIPMSDGTGEFYARGKMVNLTSYNNFSGSDLRTDTGNEKWQKINVESRSSKIYDSDGIAFTFITKYYIVLEPDIFTLNTCVSFKAGSNEVDWNKTYGKQAEQQYTIDIQILRPAHSSTSYKYVGSRDNHDRIISPTGEVLLWFNIENNMFYQPVSGMDILFKALPTDPSTLIDSDPLNPSFNTDAQYYASLTDVWNDLVKEVKLTQPVGQAGTGVTVGGTGTIISTGDMNWIYDIPTSSTAKPQVLGYYQPNAKIVSNGFPTKPLTLSSYSKTSNELLKLYLKLKILCLQDQIRGCKAVIKLYSGVSLPDIAFDLKKYLLYVQVSNMLNNADLKTLNTLKEDAMDALNKYQDLITHAKATSKEITYTFIEKNDLPLPGQKWKNGRIQRVSFNGTTTTVVAVTTPEAVVE